MINKYIFLISVISFAVLSRFLPHPPNFTPVAAIALLSCKGFNNRWIAIIIPMIIMFISDLVLGLHGSIPFVYGAFNIDFLNKTPEKRNQNESPINKGN